MTRSSNSRQENRGYGRRGGGQNSTSSITADTDFRGAEAKYSVVIESRNYRFSSHVSELRNHRLGLPTTASPSSLYH